MSVARERLERWLQTRDERLSGLPWLRTETHAGRTVRFVADEILVQDSGTALAHRTLTGLGHRSSEITEDEPAAGLRRLRASGLDVAGAVRRLRGQLPAGSVAGANHVFMSTPHEHGGPFGPPVAVDAPPAKLVPSPQTTAPVRVVVMDTGIWLDSPLPAGCYTATPENHETVLDGDADGMLDSDVGHANFIAGIVAQGTTGAQVRIVKILDSFGVCTEADLAAAITGLTDTDVLNLSLGGYTVGDLPPVALSAALQAFLSGGDRVVVAAAGNNGDGDRPFWPAAFTADTAGWAAQVLAVAAHDGTAICEWSNTGPWVSLAAPGADVVSTYIHHASFGSGWAAWSGTSFATPKVVAAIVDRVATAGSVAAAAAAVRAGAQSTPLGGYPALH
ncbi:S8/S53 family peptidase [Dactylosporangium aurantiacum]|uniref:S8/S53 family peptidase n=1 Tax=Dactylosporangium aurantiacum TaxID=35754 RepID=A0A9Q9MFU7_9ACTN|nr:S8/S53 family peptidase [Dactylosporangium aurantiacum]MDG6102736.1 S8/S53 family peptidase [Dactylosporangium aurantiacum]UWZ53020.1 S8/S53 family peptidase [Dactylosporangium aurantiacum]